MSLLWEASFCPFCGKAIKQSAGKNVEYYSPKLGESQIINDSHLSPYYQRVFKKFDANNGKFVFTWNWSAFLFGAIWYLVKGLWVKALIMIAGSVILGSLFVLIFWLSDIPWIYDYYFPIICTIILGVLPGLIFWLYCAISGNYDYYLLKRKKIQPWV